jgi:predicted dehydrogenase
MLIRVGIVGLGRIGHSFGASPQDDPLSHSEAYARLSGVEVVWGIDPERSRRAAFASRFPAATTFADVVDVPVDARADVVCVCSPTPVHADGVEVAIRQGARVIVCEKPIAPTAAAAQAVVDRCRAADRLLVVNYFRRFSPLMKHLRRAAAAGGQLAGRSRGIIRYDGGWIHNGTHWIDLCRAMFGDVLAASALPVPDQTGQDGPRTVELQFAGQRSVLFVGVTGTKYSVGEGDFLGPEGGIRFVDTGARVSTFSAVDSPIWTGYRKPGSEQLVTTDGIRGCFLELAAHAVALARDGGTPLCSGADGVAALAAAESAVAMAGAAALI